MMGYRIDYYDQPKITVHKEKGRAWRVVLGTLCFFAAFLVCVEFFWPDGREMLRSLLLNGQEAAFTQMIETLNSGEGIGEAVAAFCREVLANAGVAD